MIEEVFAACFSRGLGNIIINLSKYQISIKAFYEWINCLHIVTKAIETSTLVLEPYTEIDSSATYQCGHDLPDVR
jgi:hypothetical protein